MQEKHTIAWIHCIRTSRVFEKIWYARWMHENTLIKIIIVTQIHAYISSTLSVLPGRHWVVAKSRAKLLTKRSETGHENKVTPTIPLVSLATAHIIVMSMAVMQITSAFTSESPRPLVWQWQKSPALLSFQHSKHIVPSSAVTKIDKHEAVLSLIPFAAFQCVYWKRHRAGKEAKDQFAGLGGTVLPSKRVFRIGSTIRPFASQFRVKEGGLYIYVWMVLIPPLQASGCSLAVSPPPSYHIKTAERCTLHN